MLVITLVAVLFSSLGIIFGLLAEKFDHIAVLTTFFITPLVFVGGVFTSAQSLPPLLRQISLFNPMAYMIDAFRYSYIGAGDVPLPLSLGVVDRPVRARVRGRAADDGDRLQAADVGRSRCSPLVATRATAPARHYVT